MLNKTNQVFVESEDARAVLSALTDQHNYADRVCDEEVDEITGLLVKAQSGAGCVLINHDRWSRYQWLASHPTPQRTV